MEKGGESQARKPELEMEETETETKTETAPSCLSSFYYSILPLGTANGNSQRRNARKQGRFRSGTTESQPVTAGPGQSSGRITWTLGQK